MNCPLYQKLVSNDFGSLDLFKQNPHLKVSMPNPTGAISREKVPLFPMVVKNICMSNSELTELLNQNGIECKFSKQLENRRLKEDTEHKLAYLVKQSDREQLINFGLNLDFLHYKCELPHFLKYTKQCFKCWSFGHTKDSCDKDTMCVKCGSNHHKNDCASSFSDLCCVNCGGEHTASNLNCPKRLQYIKENPKPYIPYKKRQQEKLRGRKQANTQTSPGLGQAHPVAHQPAPQSWFEAGNQEQQLTYADVVKTQEPKTTKLVPKTSNITSTNAKLVSTSTPAKVHFESHTYEPPLLQTPQFQQTPLENSNARSSIAHISPVSSFSQQLTVETPVLSIEIFFTLLHHILNYMIHKNGPPIMEEIYSHVHGLIRNLTGIDSEAILNQSNGTQYY